MKAIKDFSAAFSVPCGAKSETDLTCPRDLKPGAFYRAAKRKNSGSRRRPSVPGIPRGPRTNGSMDKPKRIRRVAVKTERTFIFRSKPSTRIAWCADCRAEVAMISVEGASGESGYGEMEIFKLIEAHALHFCEDPEGHVLVCLNSLKQWM
jgi:hypothetical protein